ncbi:uncharacterized protein LOC142339595 [Convolutriloba macropyga]|uniref:uncharacterized protein LOC142339595 n=1 Tax=Convolutriloba macropyga TaxID=536237 RepID=UPI003F523195
MQNRFEMFLTGVYLLSHLLIVILLTSSQSVHGLASLGDECSDDWEWGDCVPWGYSDGMENGCPKEGRQEARREGLACQIIAFTIKCTPDCNKADNNKGNGGKIGGKGAGKGSNKDQSNGSEKVHNGNDMYDPNKSKHNGNSDGKGGQQNNPNKPHWGVNETTVAPPPSKTGCVFEITTDWSECDRNGYKYRSKKLIRGSSFCSKVVEEVEDCFSFGEPISAGGGGSGTNQQGDGKSGTGPIGELDSGSKGGNKDDGMAKDEPWSGESGGVNAKKDEGEVGGTECVYGRFTTWSECIEGQKYRIQNLKNGPTSCVSQNTQYKQCRKDRKSGCQYKRSEKRCGKCSAEIPKVKVCRAPLDTKTTSKTNSCDKFLVIEKPC